MSGVRLLFCHSVQFHLQINTLFLIDAKSAFLKKMNFGFISDANDWLFFFNLWAIVCSPTCDHH